MELPRLELGVGEPAPLLRRPPSRFPGIVLVLEQRRVLHVPYDLESVFGEYISSRPHVVETVETEKHRISNI